MNLPIDKVIFDKTLADSLCCDKKTTECINRLVFSMKRHGLIHPILVDENWRLLNGMKRLLACRRLGIKQSTSGL